MIVYCVLGTAPLGSDRLAAMRSGTDQYLIAFPDALRLPFNMETLSAELYRRAEEFQPQGSVNDSVSSPIRRRLDRGAGVRSSDT